MSQDATYAPRESLAGNDSRPPAPSQDTAAFGGLPEILNQSPRVQAQLKLDRSLNQPKGVVQRTLTVEGRDFTKEYKEDPARLSDIVLEITNNIIGPLIELVPDESSLDQLIKLDGPIDKQLIKWIKDEPGTFDPDRENPSSAYKQYGSKKQDREYPTWEQLAKGLLGWVEAKPGRNEERKLAEAVYANKTLTIFLDSFISKVLLKIEHLGKEGSGVDRVQAEQIHQELETGISLIENERTKQNSVRRGAIGYYREYFARKADLGGNSLASKVPENRFEILRNPAAYSIKDKIVLLHDLTEYFGDSRPWNPKVSGEGLLPPITDEETRVTTSVDEAGERVNWVSVDLRNPKKARGMGMTTSTRDEDADSTILGRDLGLPLWAGQSMTTVRMLKLAKWVGADTEEKTALALNLFAFWRQDYDHTAKQAYHTLHEVMDMAQNFGVLYAVRGGRADVGPLPELADGLARAKKRFDEMIPITQGLAARIGRNYNGPGAEQIRKAFDEIKRLHGEVTEIFSLLEPNLAAGTFDEDDAQLLGLGLEVLNQGLAVQAEIKRLVDLAVGAQ